MPLVGLLLLRELVDSITLAVSSAQPAQALAAPIRYAVLLGVVALVSAVLQGFSGYLSAVQGARLNAYLQDLIYARSVDLDLAFFENPGHQDRLHRAQQQGVRRPAAVAIKLTTLLRGGVTAAGVIVLLASIALLPLVVLVLAFAPGLLIGLRHSRRRFDWHQRRTSSTRMMQVLSSMLTTVGYAKELRLYRLGDLVRGRHSELRNELLEEDLALSRRRMTTDLLTQSLVVVALISTLVWGLRQVGAGIMSVGELVMYYGALQRLVAATRQVRSSVTGLYEDSLFLSNLREFLELRPSVRSKADAVPVVPSSVPSPARKGIELRGVTFRYPGTERDVLRDLHLQVRAGEVLALVGRNGSGKSTLVRLLCRLYDPTLGSITYNGVDLRDLEVTGYRQQFAAVFQDFSHFPLSAHDNIGFGDVTRLNDDEALLRRRPARPT